MVEACARSELDLLYCLGGNFLSTLPEPVLKVVQQVYGEATADLFLVGAPLALLAVIAVLFIREKPLSNLTGDERRAQETTLTH